MTTNNLLDNEEIKWKSSTWAENKKFLLFYKTFMI